MALINRDYEQRMKGGSDKLESPNNDITIQAGANKQTKILDNNGNPIASFDNATKKATFDNVEVVHGESIGENLVVKGNTELVGAVITKGDTTLGSNNGDTITIKGKANLDESVSMGKDLEVIGNTLLDGNVTLGDNTSDTIVFKGTPNFTDLRCENLTVDSDTTIGDSSTDTLTVKATPTFNEAIRGKKDIIIEHDAFLGSDGGDILMVKSTSTFKESMVVEKESTIKGTLTAEKGVIIGTGASDTLLVKSTAQFNENASFSKNLQVSSDTTLGVDSSNTLKVNSSSIFKEDVELDKDLEVKGDSIVRGQFISLSRTTIGDDVSDEMIVNATPTFKENTLFDKNIQVKDKLIIGEDNNDDYWKYNDSNDWLEWYEDGAVTAQLKGYKHQGGTDDRKKIVQGISRYAKNYTPLTASWENHVLVCGGDYKGGGNIDPLSLIVDVQGEMATINFQCRVKNVSEQIPTTDLTNISLNLKEILADFTPITNILDAYYTASIWYTIPTAPSEIPFYPMFCKIENNQDFKNAVFEVPESKNVTYGSPRDIDGLWFWGQVVARVQLTL